MLLEGLHFGGYTRDYGEDDLPRIRHLIERCAERHGGRVLTLDISHFGAVTREGTITLPLLGG